MRQQFQCPVEVIKYNSRRMKGLHNVGMSLDMINAKRSYMASIQFRDGELYFALWPDESVSN